MTVSRISDYRCVQKLNDKLIAESPETTSKLRPNTIDYCVWYHNVLHNVSLSEGQQADERPGGRCDMRLSRIINLI